MPELTEALRARIGVPVTYTSPEPMGAAAGRYFATAIGDENPLYTDEQYAREAGLEGITLPPTLVCETNQYTGLTAGDDGNAGHNWGLEIPGTRQVRGGNTYTFFRRVRPDDRVTATFELQSIEPKTSRSGAGMLIFTAVVTYTDELGAPLARNEETLIVIDVESGR
jgi:acyl dehydratase